MNHRFLAALAICIALPACTDGPAVTADGERLAGAYVGKTGIAAFRGIPFAEPPVGELRWQPPQPLRSTMPERDAKEFAPACMQSMGILEWYRDMAEIFGSTRDEFEDLEISEDCLYLNVWTPDLDENAGLPVMVYIHGGSNDSGWAYEPDYHGHVLAERGVILVSIAYRVGVFGFFSHPGIDAESAAANFGLWDQVAALEWIQENIRAFGGDPERVTVFGESAGSQDVLALMTSDHARGLFHRAIMQSNAGFGIGLRGSRTLEGERQRGLETAALFGHEGEGSLQALKSIPADELLARYEEEFGSYYHAPAVDGQLLTRSVWESINDGSLEGTPFIIGSNGDEWYDRIPEDVGKEALLKAIESTAYLNSPLVVDAMMSEPDIRKAIDRVSAGDGMLCPSQYMAALYDSAWVYHFTRIREGDGGAKVRAYHGAELPYTFGTHPAWMNTTDADRALTGQILTYWTQFAATGNPNTNGVPDWPAFNVAGNRVMQFGDLARAVDAPEQVLCRVFRDAVANQPVD